MITYEQIKAANEEIRTTGIKGKQYAEVNQRVKAFRVVYPDGYIETEMMSNENGVCVFKAVAGYYSTTGEKRVLGVGTAYEKEDSSYINKTSYIENCETSAVGRALGMCGFGIDTSICSAEELQNAINNQETKDEPKDEPKATPKQIDVLQKTYTGANLEKLLKANNISKLEELPMKTASNIISKLGGKKNG